MKKTLLTLVAAAACLAAGAVPAWRGVQQVTQPNGETLTVRINGDEFYGYLTTADGYTIVKDSDGYYRYATLNGDEVVATAMVAADAGKRTAAENAWLTATGKHLRSQAKVATGRQARARRDAISTKAINYSAFRGLVILVNFKDAKFTRGDVVDFYDRMINEENYTGYTNEDGTANRYGSCTGSVRDYFYDNSNGKFAPQFDVVGPVEVNYNVNQGRSQAYSILLAAARAADSMIDYSKYDVNNDGYVDLIYFIVADTPSASDSSNPNHLWPHRSRFSSMMKYDGKYFGDYACSAEYVYAKSNGIFDGIGTICHEFSHVLGLPDLYDTDYEENGESQHPGEWDLMAGGGYMNNSRTPVAYSLYNRYATGFADYQVITAAGDYELPAIGTTGKGYILNSPVNKEKFLIENRQATKWDRYAPGHGMVVARMDSTNASVWNANDVNDNASRLYYELLRAGQSQATQAATDPFPGTRAVGMISNETPANFLTYAKRPNQFIFHNIREENQVIKFSVVPDGSLKSVVEDFETMEPMTGATNMGVQGTLAKWNFAKCNPATPADTLRNGDISIGLVYPSTMTMAEDVAYKTTYITFDAYNSAGSEAKLQLYMSTDEGKTWTLQNNAIGSNSTMVMAKKKSRLYFPISVSVPARYRIACTSGSKTAAVYIDDFTIYNDGEIPQGLTGDVNGDGSVNAADVTALYNYILNGDNTFISASDVNGDGSVNAGDVTAVYNIILGL